MQRFSRYGLLFAFLAAMTLLAISIQQHRVNPAPTAHPLDGWDIPVLAEHLNHMGVEVRLCPVPKNGPINESAFLTSTDKDWKALNMLNKDPRRTREWRGTLYCELVAGRHVTHLIDQWGDHCLAVGPFLFYGDIELLDRVGAVLAPLAPPAAP